MCVTSAAASLSETRILSVRLSEQKHLLCYTNKAKNLTVLPNSMILPVPGKLSEADFIDTTPFPGFMTELQRYLTPGSRTLGGGTKGISGDSLRSRNVQHFKSGMYEVFVADPAPVRTIAERIVGARHPVNEALEVMPPFDRPTISESLLEFYDSNYPGWSLVVCVFGPSKVMDSQPIMFTYEPLQEWKDRVFFPAVDSHNGGAPRLTEEVDVDHFLITTSTRGHEVPPMKMCPPILHGLKLVGLPMHDSMPNGDWTGNVSDQNSFYPMLKRAAPLVA
jgi:hypothetical protein